MYLHILLKLFIVLSFTLLINSCTNSYKNNNQVIVYTSVDQIFASKILKQFEQKSGIKVKAVYDTEASKAVGLEKRLLAEKRKPRADIFWNSEFLRTENLAKKGILKNLSSTSKKYMKKIGLRARVIIVNTNMLKKKDYPHSLQDLVKSKYKDKIAISSPYFGTTATHFAALYSKFGVKKFSLFIKALKSNHVAFLAGNSVVKNAVGNGRYAIGLVDTDDALVGIAQGLPIKMLYYDQNKQGMFAIYQTVSIIKGAPHLKNAQKLLNYLLTSKIEHELIDVHAIQFSLAQLTKHKIPKLWTLSAKKTLISLKPSIKILRSGLE